MNRIKINVLIVFVLTLIVSNQLHAEATQNTETTKLQNSQQLEKAKNTPISKMTVKEYIVKHSLDMGVDPALALSLAKLESGYDHTKRSPYGAIGVFQILPSTASSLGYNAYHLNDNIKGGLAYYKMMYNKFGSMDLALAAYNAGPGNVSKYKGVPPFAETKKFISLIKAEYKQQKSNPDPALIKHGAHKL